MPNVEALRALAKKLRRLRHEEHYNQRVWATKTACGTAACVAGHAAVMAGWKLLPQPRHDQSGTCCVKGKDEGAVEVVGAEVLGLDWPCNLFSEDPATSWPEPFRSRWKKRERSGERPSRIAADYLEAIANGEVEG